MSVEQVFHTDNRGKIWSLCSNSVVQSCSKEDFEQKLIACDYRVIGIPQNYRLISDLYAYLVAKNGKTKLWVGCPKLLTGEPTSLDCLLRRFNFLTPQDNLPLYWHPVTDISYTNFLLLQLVQSNRAPEVIANLYNYHCLKPFLDFAGLFDVDSAVSLIALIRDPRWYIDAGRFYRLDSLLRYFGLICSKNKKSQQRKNQLFSVCRSLSNDSPIRIEASLRRANKPADYILGRVLVLYAARVWLSLLVPAINFDSQKFFSSNVLHQAYYNRFSDYGGS